VEVRSGKNQEICSNRFVPFMPRGIKGLINGRLLMHSKLNKDGENLDRPLRGTLFLSLDVDK